VDKIKGSSVMAEGKVVVITGSTSGIGKSLYSHYTEQGYDAIPCGRQQSVLDQLKETAATTLCFDITDDLAVKQAASQISSLDILILNAGNCRYIEDPINFDADLFADVLSTNLRSMGYLLQAFLPKLNTGGQVVFISSSATILPFPRSQAYGASKAGVDYLANSLRLDLAARNIDVTLVHPGFIKTPLTDKNDFDMPFLLTSEEAALRIFEGVKARKKYLHFPKRLTWILKAFSFLPASIWQFIILRK
jgi:NAD(P)-dependent dehydrogenase (short-subunit alcohol dehydrogenase family)